MDTRIKSYFSKRENLLTFLALAVICAAGFALRITNLSYLSFWGDDGHTFIGTMSIIEHGYPLLPSGNILYHGILGYYFNVIPVLVFGATEFAFRFTSVSFSIMSIVLIYLFGKYLANRYVGLLSAAVLSFSTWYVIFSREARYYQALQFFFLLTFMFFYLGFFRQKRPYRILAAVFMGLTPLVHGVGIMLLLLFIPLLVFLRKRFFKREVLVPLAAVAAFNLLWVANQVLFWQVGRSFYTQETGLGALVGAYFRLPDSFYIRRVSEMFPEMTAVVISGAFLFLIFAAGLTIRHGIKVSYFGLDELELRIGRLRVPYNYFLIQSAFWLIILVVSIGRMYNQQRYIYFLMPAFILIFSYSVYLLSALITKAISHLYFLSNKKHGLPKRISNRLMALLFALIAIFTVSGIDPIEAARVADITHADRLDVHYSISNVWDRRWDAELPGRHIAQNMQEDDIVITTDVYNTPPYSGALHYWLWTGDLVSWAPYQKIGDHYYDDTYGVRVLRNFAELFDVLNAHTERNVWVATSYSLFIPEHISPRIRDFFDASQEELVLIGRDDTARLYHFPATEEALRVETTDFFEEGQVSHVDIRGRNEYFLDFTDPENSGYLAYGFSRTEPGIGTWSALESSFILFEADKDTDYILEVRARPFSVAQRTQVLEVFVNGSRAGSQAFIEAHDFSSLTFKIPSAQIIEGTGYIEFRYAYAVSPLELGLSTDRRQLAVLYKEVLISKE
jgi:4-amino-4-deoxy-L-arabinose transferase-like glycosyltransferase